MWGRSVDTSIIQNFWLRMAVRPVPEQVGRARVLYCPWIGRYLNIVFSPTAPPLCTLNTEKGKMAFVSPCNSHYPCLILGHELIYIEGWTVGTALALAKITQPPDNGNHLFPGPTSLQSCFPPTWAPGCTTGPSSPPGLPFLYLKSETQPLKRTHKNLSYVDPYTLPCPYHLLLVTPPAPIDSCTLFFCPLQVLSQLQGPGSHFHIWCSLCQDSGCGNTQIIHRASFY